MNRCSERWPKCLICGERLNSNGFCVSCWELQQEFQRRWEAKCFRGAVPHFLVEQEEEVVEHSLDLPPWVWRVLLGLAALLFWAIVWEFLSCW